MKKYKPPKYLCVNCNKIISPERPIKLFCSELCTQEASLVRYARRCIKDGRINRPDIKEAIKIRFAHIASGGYPEKIRKIPNSIKKLVFKRDKGRCQICGKVGKEIDHIKGNACSLENLQLLCRECHVKKTVQNLVKISPQDSFYNKFCKIKWKIWIRMYSKKPLIICDDENNWEEASVNIKNERKNIFFKSLLPFIKELVLKNANYREISRKLNSLKLPTFTGRGFWDHSCTKYFNVFKSRNQGL